METQQQKQTRLLMKQLDHIDMMIDIADGAAETTQRLKQQRNIVLEKLCTPTPQPDAGDGENGDER